MKTSLKAQRRSQKVLTRSRKRVSRRSSPDWDPTLDAARFTMWSNAFKSGQYQLAWHINSLREKHWPSAYRFCQGELPSHCSLVVVGLHGLGDVVQMCRFLPSLKKRGCSVACYVRPELLSLVPLIDGAEDIPFHDVHGLSNETSPSGGSQVEFMELLHLFRLTEKQIPHLPYLCVPEEQSALVRLRMGKKTKPRVGILWSGSAYDPERWFSFSDIRSLLKCEEFEFWNIQHGGATFDTAGLTLRRAADVLQTNELAEYCALLANLDLIITPDTLAAHLAGALGRPVWIMLKHDADWRWMKDRTDSPWYATAKLFRQQKPHDWRGLAAQVGAALCNEFIVA